MGFVGGISSQTTERSRYRFMHGYGVRVGRGSSESAGLLAVRKKEGWEAGASRHKQGCKDGPKPSDMNWNPHRSRTASKFPASVRWLTHKASGTLHHQARPLAASERDGRRAPGGIWRSSGVVVTSLAGESADEWPCVSSTSA